MARSEGDLRQARRDAAALKPGTLLANNIWPAPATVLVLSKVRKHGFQYYEVLITYADPEENALRGGVQLWRAKDLIEVFEVQHEAG